MNLQIFFIYFVILNNSKLAYRIYVILIANKELINKKNVTYFKISATQPLTNYLYTFRRKFDTSDLVLDIELLKIFNRRTSFLASSIHCISISLRTLSHIKIRHSSNTIETHSGWDCVKIPVSELICPWIQFNCPQEGTGAIL
jgi:hypothetical protein